MSALITYILLSLFSAAVAANRWKKKKKKKSVNYMQHQELLKIITLICETAFATMSWNDKNISISYG